MYYKCDEGCYRLSIFIDNVIAPDDTKDAKTFYECAVAFGHFQKKLANFPADTLFETIKDFHNTQWRLDNLKAAVKADKAGRLAQVQKEVEFALAREKDIDTGITLPLRVTHNDTKLNNVLLDKETGKPICVIDLDTVMPGLSLYDYGDSMRFGTNPTDEDDKDLSRVYSDLNLFEEYTKGFLEECGDALTPKEIELLPISALVLTYECGIRFLGDFVDGDNYFHTDRPEHNLDRCRTQFKLVADMEAKLPQMKAIVAKYAK
jgi:Ser/Thr protein kinase RdoA (MazF antagonist)